MKQQIKFVVLILFPFFNWNHVVCMCNAGFSFEVDSQIWAFLISQLFLVHIREQKCNTFL
jgi:hypothetical protein